jgi:hypothetical protein
MSQAAFTRARPRLDDQSSPHRKDRAPQIGVGLPLAAGSVSPRGPQGSLPAAFADAATPAELERLYQWFGEARETVRLQMRSGAERFRLAEEPPKPHDDRPASHHPPIWTL